MIEQILKNAYALAMLHVGDDGQTGEHARLIAAGIQRHFKGIARQYEEDEG